MEQPRIDETAEYGSDAGRGNLLGIQPYMLRSDYASEDAFFARLDGYFQAARERGWINEKTIVVLPEYLGTWLVVEGERAAAYRAETVAAAMQVLVRAHLLPFLRGFLTSPEKDRAAATLFRIKAARMAKVYQSASACLARTYGVTLVAGSILLPEPRVEHGRLVTAPGKLYNTSAVFRPDGSIEPALARKIYLMADELPFVAAAAVEDLPAYETPAGRLGVLVCADSWYPPPYDQLKKHGAEILAVPSALFPAGIWESPWRGYNGAPAPDDVDPADASVLTEAQAWAKYSLYGRIARAGARAGINVFLHGDLWDLKMNAGRWRMVSGQTNIDGQRDGGVLANLWLQAG